VVLGIRRAAGFRTPHRLHDEVPARIADQPSQRLELSLEPIEVIGDRLGGSELGPDPGLGSGGTDVGGRSRIRCTVEGHGPGYEEHVIIAEAGSVCDRGGDVSRVIDSDPRANRARQRGAEDHPGEQTSQDQESQCLHHVEFIRSFSTAATNPHGAIGSSAYPWQRSWRVFGKKAPVPGGFHSSVRSVGRRFVYCFAFADCCFRNASCSFLRSFQFFLRYFCSSLVMILKGVCT